MTSPGARGCLGMRLEGGRRGRTLGPGPLGALRAWWPRALPLSSYRPWLTAGAEWLLWFGLHFNSKAEKAEETVSVIHGGVWPRFLLESENSGRLEGVGDGLLSLVRFQGGWFLPTGQGGRQPGACPGGAGWGVGGGEWGGEAESWGCS